MKKILVGLVTAIALAACGGVEFEEGATYDATLPDCPSNSDGPHIQEGGFCRCRDGSANAGTIFICHGSDNQAGCSPESFMQLCNGTSNSVADDVDLDFGPQMSSPNTARSARARR